MKECPVCFQRHKKSGTYCSLTCSNKSRIKKNFIKIKECPKCKKLHEKPGTFCSQSCANSKTSSDRVPLKRALVIKDENDQKEKREKLKEAKLLKNKSTPFELLGLTNKRKRVFEEQKYSCNRCSLDTWLGSPITLELEHKDGNNKNNNRENLEALCPNCHSLTSTWKGKNIKKKSEKISDEFLIECLNDSSSFRQALIKADMTPKGGNYNRIKKLMNDPAFDPTKHLKNKEDAKNEPKIHKKNLVKYECPVCGVSFLRERHKSHFTIPKQSMTCSRKCGGIIGHSKTTNKIIVLEEYVE